MKTISRFCVFVLVLMIISLICVSATSQRLVRVGYTKGYEFFYKDATGEFDGYGVKYLNEIAKHTGWRYQYVEGDWTTNLEKLKNGEIDLMAPVQFTDERAQTLDFCMLPIAEEHDTIFARKKDETLYYNDFEGWDSLLVGMDENTYQAKIFEQFAKENGFRYRAVYYQKMDTMARELERGTIDAMLCGSLARTSDFKVIGKIGFNSVYFATTKGNKPVLSGLNKAIKMVKQENPYFDNELFQKYYGNDAITEPNFTKEEKQYINSKPTIRIVYNPHWYPIEFYDKENKKFDGFVYQVTKILSSKLDIEFEYVATSGFNESLQYIKEGKADVLAAYSMGFNPASENFFQPTIPYFEIPIVLVGRNDSIKDFSGTIGVSKDFKTASNYCINIYSNAKTILYDKEYDILHNIISKDVDMGLVTSYAYDDFLRYEAGGEYIFIINSGNLSYPISMGIGNMANPQLYSVINKTLASIHAEEFNKLMFETVVQKKYSVTFYSVISEYSGFIAVLAIILAMYLYWNSKRFIKLAYNDPITGFTNYAKFNEQLKNEIKYGRHIGKAFVFFDVDKFKYINSEYGYDMGNTILTTISNKLKTMMDSGEIFSRTNADNFIIYCNHYSHQQMEQNIHNFTLQLNQAFLNGEIPINPRFKFGVYYLKDTDKSVSAALDKAHIANRTIKDKGALHVCFYDSDIENNALKEKNIEYSMEDALKSKEFVVYIQPKFSLCDKKLIGGEALVRWNSPDKGIISPADFIPIFEKNGFISKLDMYMISNVCAAIKNWISEKQVYITISVNLSRVNFDNEQIVEDIVKIVDFYDVPRELIEFELTEGVIYRDIERLVTIMQRLKQEGFMLSMDDFGSGYSSLGLLPTIPIDVIKLDRCLVVDILESNKQKQVMSAVITLSKELGFTVLCEGVETAEQAECIKEMGCDLVQGYLYSKPITLQLFEEIYIK